jgi:hypothetical protein
MSGSAGIDGEDATITATYYTSFPAGEGERIGERQDNNRQNDRTAQAVQHAISIYG